MNVIIIATIALLVLTIMIFILTRTSTTFFEGTNCEGLGGICVDENSICGPEYTSSSYHCKKDDAGNKQHCCVNPASKT